MLCSYSLDVEDVKFVINFDYPSSSEDYIHRIGRTGRSQQSGTAYAFFTLHNIKHAGDLVSVLQETNQVVNPMLVEMANTAKTGKCLSRGNQTDRITLYHKFLCFDFPEWIKKIWALSIIGVNCWLEVFYLFCPQNQQDFQINRYKINIY